MLVKLLSIFALGASTAFVSATPSSTPRALDLNPPTSVLENSNYNPIPQLTARGLTNAKRLAAGLPLKPPTRRTRTHVSRSQPSGVPPASGSSGNGGGYLEARDSDGKCLGFVSKVQNAFGEYVVQDQKEDSDLRLRVSFDMNAEGVTDIQTTNGPDTDLPYLGGVKGFASDSTNIEEGSPNYIYIAGTVQTSPNEPASDGSNTFTQVTSIAAQIESAIWSYNADTSVIAPQWINEDSGSPTTYVAIADGVIVLTGDKTELAEQLGPVDWVSLYYVPA
ncbi:hypothetical protein H0H81_009467 [Sphagnurus paluster]|uniref:Uncharacterized protein n=1 Tax=Sphagnurus paluster TaxID=117069 RepID=A0A9P7FPM3_9AGAR|nr:hypothetical protein H0H81_009467 [Sphagnurus paluster]